MKRIIICSTLFIFCSFIAVRAQQIESSSSIDSSNYRIGEWINVHLEVKAPKDFRVVIPSPKDSIGQFDIVNQDQAKESEESGIKIYSKTFTITKFDSGFFSIPPIITTYYKPNDTSSYIVATQPLPVTIKTIQVDSTGSFKDIKDVMHVSLTIWDYLLYLGIILAVIALSYFGYKYYKKRQERPEEAPPEVIIPPHVVALESLHHLEEKHLWEKGFDKEYQSELTDILRRYIEDRYRIPALEMTSNELISQIVFSGVDRPLIEELNSILQRADLTKFAKYHPAPNEHSFAMKGAYHFIDESKPDDVETDLSAQVADDQNSIDGSKSTGNTGENHV